jgi:hypothetical protein
VVAGIAAVMWAFLREPGFVAQTMSTLGGSSDVRWLPVSTEVSPTESVRRLAQGGHLIAPRSTSNLDATRNNWPVLLARTRDAVCNRETLGLR